MTEEKASEPTYSYCALPGNHRDHMCHLMERGMTAEIRSRSTRPAFACRNCGARADAAGDLCNPQPLQEARR